MTQENPPLTSALDAIKAAVGPQGWLEAADDVAPYVLDWRRKWPGASPLVVRPACIQELAEVMRLCAAHQISVVPQSGNTGLVGGSGPRANGRDIVLSLNRMAAIREVDPVNNTMTVEAGCILADIQAAADGHDRIYPLSLAAEGSCRIGGNLSTNAGGTNVLRYGNARDHVLGLEVVLADGRIWDGLRGLRKDNTGYDLKQLFLGSEGTLGIITAAVLKLWPKPRQTVTSWLGVPNAHAAVAILNKAQAASGSQITGFEYIVRDALELTLANMPQNRNPLTGTHAACVLMEATSGQDGDGLRNTVEAILADAMEEGLIEDAAIAESDGQAKALWQIREDIPEAQIHAGGGLKHDVAVPVSKVADFLDEATALVHKIAPMARVIAFGHLGDGNIHFNQSAVTLDRQDELLALERDVNDAVESLAVTMGGSFSAEHGVGRLRLRQMSLYKSEVERDLMASIKQTLDPAGLLNPGKVVAFERDAG